MDDAIPHLPPRQLVGARHAFRHRLILDLRDPLEFHAWHLAHSYNILVWGLPSRYSYLPTREQSFLVIADVEQRYTVLQAMEEYRSAQIVFLGSPQHLWRRVNGPMSEKGAFFEKAKARGLLRRSSTLEARLLTSNDDVPRLLFQPSNAVKRLVTQIEQDYPGRAPKRVLDLGCGAGRDLIWILHRHREGTPITWRGIGLDNWKATVMRARKEVRELGLRNTDAAQPGCEAVIWAKCTDAGAIVPLAGSGKGKAISDDTDNVEEIEDLRLFHHHGLALLVGLPEALRYELIVCVRFYPLATLMRVSSLVKMNGYVLISHFVALNEDEKAAVSQLQPSAIVDYESPPPEGRIQPGQIEELVQTWNTSESERCRWLVCEDKLEPIEDGRLVRSVALQRVSESP